MDNNDPRENLHRLFNEDEEFAIGDPTEIHRLQAKKTKYVGKVGKGKKLGFWMLTLASPYKGRAIPFNQGTVNCCLKAIMADILPSRIIKMDYDSVFLYCGMDFQSYLAILFWEMSELVS